uniref:Inhibitor of apoptosis-promoting Bax1 family protein n=1 Tax=Schistosoma mansoni TaxID=6183 RepID=A0A5K4F9K8_SCHMA
MSVILLFITSVLALLIAFVKKISDTFPLNVIILFTYSAAVVFYVLTDIASFFITIFVSQITVGKSALRIFCTEYTLAALLLYNMFSTSYVITTGMVCNITNTCNNSNVSVSLSDNLPRYIVLI